MAEPIPLRRTPTQKRARERVARILAATEQLFAEGGVEAVTTNHVAKRAGVDIRSVYYFFSDKFQIFEAILRRDAEALTAHIERLQEQQFGSAGEWIDRLVEAHAGVVRRPDASTRLFQALRGRSEVETLVREYDAHIIDVLCEGLRRHCPAIPSSRRRGAATLINFTLAALLDPSLASLSPRDRNAALREMRGMLRAYAGGAA